MWLGSHFGSSSYFCQVRLVTNYKLHLGGWGFVFSTELLIFLVTYHVNMAVVHKTYKSVICCVPGV